MTTSNLGAALRNARETAGLTIEDVSARTCIRGTVLRDLEADRVGSSGGVVYARGHVKSICAVVGVAAAPYLEQFGRQYGGDADLPAQPAPHVPTASPPERRGPNWAVAGALAVVVLVGLLVAGQITKPESESVDATVTEPRVPAVASPAPARKVTAARPAPTGALLRLRLLGGDSWVSVRSGTRTLYEGVLRAGTVKEFRDPTSLRIAVGNAGAVDVTCAGKAVGRAGGRGQVERFRCDAKGIARA